MCLVEDMMEDSKIDGSAVRTSVGQFPFTMARDLRLIPGLGGTGATANSLDAGATPTPRYRPNGRCEAPFCCRTQFGGAGPRQGEAMRGEAGQGGRTGIAMYGTVCDGVP